MECLPEGKLDLTTHTSLNGSIALHTQHYLLGLIVVTLCVTFDVDAVGQDKHIM